MIARVVSVTGIARVYAPACVVLLVCQASADTNMSASHCIPPQAIAIAGLEADSAAGLLNWSAIDEDVQAAADQYSDTFSELIQAQTTKSAALEAIKHSPVTPQSATAYEAALASLNAKQQAAEDIREALNQLIIDRIAETHGQANAELAATFVTNTHRPVPDEYKVLDLTETEWATLESALSHIEEHADLEAIAEDADTSIPELQLSSEESQVLAAVNASPDVALAKQRIDAHADGIEQVFAEAIEGIEE